ncbi:hypothetical protein GCM10025778_25410 [Paeniglutamicibacter antarcticus]|uniref:Uncharacterized protein n=1 Tax=Paeniglutamicibacter antarcticus TaxID=494023 RepID=A0ABP9TQ68_9MICC
MGLLLLIITLLVGLVGSLLASPLLDPRGVTPEVGLVRWVAIAHVVVAGGATLYRLAVVEIEPSVGVDMPVREFRPVLPENASLAGPAATVISGGVPGLSSTSRVRRRAPGILASPGKRGRNVERARLRLAGPA